MTRYLGYVSLAEENAEFLGNLVRGVDLSVSRSIGFAHLFHSKFAAMQFKRAAESVGYQVQVKLFPPFEVEEPKGLGRGCVDGVGAVR